MPHTPGHWHADGAEVYADGLEWVAEALNDKLPDGGEANANLIAAAPDLLAALKAAYRFEGRFIATWQPEFQPDWFKAAREVLAKAEGRDAE
jgi:hypothetical protein